MSWNCVEENWREFKGHIKTQWNKLTDDHLDHIDGKRDILVGKIQEHYGIEQDAAELQVADWEHRNRDFIAETAAAIRKLPKSLHGATE